MALLAVSAVAQEAADPAQTGSAIKFSALLDTGATFATHDPPSGTNFGHLFTDKHDQLLLNQLMLTAQKDLDPKATDFDWGFKVQGLFGSDARYTHFLGVFDRATESRYQFDITEANLLGHVPWLGQGGMDVKLGMYTTPMGSEVIPANGNYLYSHSYIFNFGLPFKHTGVLTTTHATDLIDVYAGIDTGANTTSGDKGDNNAGLAGMLGLGFNLLDGKLTILGLAHFGPEDASDRGPLGNPHANDTFKTFGDIAVTYKPSDDWAFVSEFNYVKDDLLHATGYGFAQYAVYNVKPWLSLVGRAEVWNDPDHTFVSAFPGNRDAVNAAWGMPTDKTIIVPSQGSLYSEFTIGANIKPLGLPAALEGTMIRPEVRYDRSLNGVAAYNDLRSKDQWSFGIDLVMPVAF